MDGARIVGTEFHKPIRTRATRERRAFQMRECDGEPNNTTGLVGDHPIPAVGSPKTLATPGAFPSLVVTRIAPSALHRNYILITRAHRPRHVRAFWRSWLARLEGGFHSRVTLGAVGALRRFCRHAVPKAEHSHPVCEKNQNQRRLLCRKH
jgi:hypothetical protein